MFQKFLTSLCFNREDLTRRYFKTMLQEFPFFKDILNTWGTAEASSLDQINMTKNQLEFDGKKWQRRTLTLELDRNFPTGEYDRNIDEFDRKTTTTTTNIYPLMLVVVVIFIKFSSLSIFRSNSFGHLDSVQWITLAQPSRNWSIFADLFCIKSNELKLFYKATKKLKWLK